MKQNRSLIKPVVALAAVGLWLYIHRYPTARIPTACEKFTAGVAIDFVRPEWCGRVPVEAESGLGGFGLKGFQVSSWRSDCFLATAVKTKNIKLCNDVRPIRTGLLDGYLDGSGYSAAYCIDLVASSHGHWQQMGLLPMSNYELSPVMHQLGYTDQTLLDEGVSANDTYGWYTYVDKLLWNSRGMPRYESVQQEKRDFLRRVDNLRCGGPLADIAWKVGTTLVLALVTFWAASELYSRIRQT